MITLGEARPTVARVLGGACSTASEVRAIINEACGRLCSRGKYVGATGRYRLCITRGQITWPRRVSAILSWAYCETPGVLQGEYFEFMGDGVGILDSDDGIGHQLVDAGRSAVHTDVPYSADPVMLVAYSTNNADNGKTIRVRYVSNDTKVTTATGEGELLTLGNAGAGIVSTYAVKQRASDGTPGVYGVTKETTGYPVTLYARDTGTMIETQLGRYEPNEITAEYRRSYLPGYDTLEDCTDADSFCGGRYVDIIGKHRHIDAVADHDPLSIGNLAAVKDMAQAIWYRENGKLQESVALEAAAIRELETELQQYIGTGEAVNFRFMDRSLWGAGGVTTTQGYY